jgi:phenylacetate-coenzyme A ligase PaaK-like adenylate-forming protein
VPLRERAPLRHGDAGLVRFLLFAFSCRDRLLSERATPDRRMAIHPFKKIYGNCVILANLRGQRTFPYAAREEIERVRDARVRWMVRYAAETVPYYREFFGKRKIDPREIRTADDLKRLPLLTKKTVRQDPELFNSESKWGKSAVIFQTRGSTGFAVKLKHDVPSLLANVGFGEREREVITRVGGRKLGYKEVYLGIPAWTIGQVWSFYREWTFVPVRPQRRVILVTEPIEQIIAEINDFKPDVMVGVGSFIELLFRTVFARGLAMRNPRLAVYAGDAMSPEGKRFIEEQCGVAVLT